MPQMSPTLWTLLFLFNIFTFIMINMMIYFKWTPFNYNENSLKTKKEWQHIFKYNDHENF